MVIYNIRYIIYAGDITGKRSVTVRLDKELADWLEGLSMEGKSKEQIIATVLHAAMAESRLPIT